MVSSENQDLIKLNHFFFFIQGATAASCMTSPAVVYRANDEESSQVSHSAQELLGSITRTFIAGGGKRFSARLRTAQQQLDTVSASSTKLVESAAIESAKAFTDATTKLNEAVRKVVDTTGERCKGLCVHYATVENTLQENIRTATKLRKELNDLEQSVDAYVKANAYFTPVTVFGACLFFVLLLLHAFIVSVYGTSAGSRMILWLASGWGCFTLGVAVCVFAIQLRK
jgi:hypothetical protein